MITNKLDAVTMQSKNTPLLKMNNNCPKSLSYLEMVILIT